MRNLVAAEMSENPGKYKAKSFSGRGNRRANSNRNRFDWRDEVECDTTWENTHTDREFIE